VLKKKCLGEGEKQHDDEVGVLVSRVERKIRGEEKRGEEEKKKRKKRKKKDRFV